MSIQYAVQVPITVSGVRVEPGDLIFADASEGVVSIPKSMVDNVLDWLQKRGDSEEQIKEAIRSGTSVEDAFKMYR